MLLELYIAYIKIFELPENLIQDCRSVAPYSIIMKLSVQRSFEHSKYFMSFEKMSAFRCNSLHQS